MCRCVRLCVWATESSDILHLHFRSWGSRQEPGVRGKGSRTEEHASSVGLAVLIRAAWHFPLLRKLVAICLYQEKGGIRESSLNLKFGENNLHS